MIHVHLPRDLASKVPRDKLMTEHQWRALGIQQSLGWVHYMIHKPEPHIILFRRPRTDILKQDTSKVNTAQPMKAQ
ncbi:Cyclin-dependent kinases regulatory subunit 2 [Cichlidogyrus casuarinus]|uniref:Cyclin-dependent kinases regulatory subunit n=1 Tax=Cichlidogyrus casuarinus TaxID=1844966 RepID=A0ABD2QKE2_9PLAT